MREDRFSYRLGCGLATFLLVDFSWLFFRAKSIGNAVSILKQIILSLQPEKIFGLAVNRMGYTMQQLVALIFAMLLLFVFDILKNHMYLMSKNDMQSLKDGSIEQSGPFQNVFQIILSQGMWFRWLVYLGLLFMILVYGAYGLEYTQTEFIYFQF